MSRLHFGNIEGILHHCHQCHENISEQAAKMSRKISLHRFFLIVDGQMAKKKMEDSAAGDSDAMKKDFD
jgi:hypothetical protein